MALDEIYILNAKHEKIRLIDNAKSVIWTNRYSECGDFEIYIKASSELLSLLKNNEELYVTRFDNSMIGVIENFTITTSENEMDYLIITGRCLASILDRRIIKTKPFWNTKTTVVGVLAGLIDNNIGYLASATRKITSSLSTDEVGTKYVQHIESENYINKNLYTVVTDICKQYEYGVRGEFTSNGLTFAIYTGVDRTYEHDNVNPVVFSTKYNNLIKSEYAHITKDSANEIYIEGTNSPDGKHYSVTTTENKTGLALREYFLNAHDVQKSNPETGADISEATYLTILRDKARKELTKHKVKHTFVGEISTNNMYKYRSDYKLGDIVRVENDYGASGVFRITEVVESLDENGYKMIPVFSETKQGGI